MSGMNGWVIFGGIGMLVFWVVIIALVIWVVKRFTHTPGDTRSDLRDSPLDILKRRYARGDISKEDYERMKDELS